MSYLYDFVLFLAKSLSLVLLIGGGLVAVLLAAGRGRARKGQLHCEDLSASQREIRDSLEQQVLDKKALKTLRKTRKAEEKASSKAPVTPKLFVIDFRGSMDAHEAAALREEVSAVLTLAQPQDEVLVRVESPGGVVHGYGLCASQLQRLRDRGLHLTVAVDKVAASGGYMMACVAQHIMAAPFAIVGSIGVVAQLPNFHRLLQKHDIDYEQHTAGAFKRTLTVFGENDDAGREKFREELEAIHQQFKQFIHRHRPQIDLAQVATGEHWLASDALALKLVDELRTSDDYLQEQCARRQVIRVQYQLPKRLGERLGRQVSTAVERGILQALGALRSSVWR